MAVYTAPAGLGFQLPSWGSHGGPLTVSADATGGGVTLTRWTAPAAASGAMTSQTTDASTMIPSGAFLSAQAVDLPFFGWTVVSWAGPAPSTAGAFAMLNGAALVTSYTVNGPYSAGGVPAAASLGRFLYSGLSPLGQPSSNQNGLYAADACSSPSQELGAGTGCGAPALVAAWGESTGPVAVDSAQDVFAVMASTSAGTQEARGFLASSVARGAPATPRARRDRTAIHHRGQPGTGGAPLGRSYFGLEHDVRRADSHALSAASSTPRARTSSGGATTAASTCSWSSEWRR